MLKNVPSDKMDDPTVEPIGINTLFCKAELTGERAKKMLKFSLYGCFFSSNLKSFAIAAKKKKSNPVFIFSAVVFWECLGPPHCVFMNSYCGCHYFHIVLAEKRLTEGN